MPDAPTMADAWLLFGHVIGVVVLTAGIGLEVYAVTAAGRATTVAELRLAVRAARTLPVVMPLATLLMTGCGLALVAHDPTFHFGDAWVVSAIGVVVAISVVGGGFSGRPASRLLDAADATPEGPLPPHLAALVRDPVLLASARITAIAAAWAIWLMSVRPHAAGAMVSLAAAAMLSVGAVAASVTPTRPVVGSDVGAAALGSPVGGIGVAAPGSRSPVGGVGAAAPGSSVGGVVPAGQERAGSPGVGGGAAAAGGLGGMAGGGAGGRGAGGGTNLPGKASGAGPASGRGEPNSGGPAAGTA